MVKCVQQPLGGGRAPCVKGSGVVTAASVQHGSDPWSGTHMLWGGHKRKINQ